MNHPRRSLRFINAAHFLDHYVLLVFPTVVIGLEIELQRSYGELRALATACVVAFGLFSLPWGWLGDHWSRRRLMAIFFFGAAASLAAAAATSDMLVLACSLFALGVFAAIYHPVGITVLLANAKDRGRDVAMNGVWGNLGVATAPAVTALIASAYVWRAAFAAPAVVCATIGVAYLLLTEETHEKKENRSQHAEVALTLRMAAVFFACFAVASLAGGLVFNTITVAIPKIVDERFAADIPLAWIGLVATLILLFGGVDQIRGGWV